MFLTQEKLAQKKLKHLIDSAEKLAALQFRAGKYAGKPEEINLKPKVDKAWRDFQLAADTVLNEKFMIKQENNVSITLDRRKS